MSPKLRKKGTFVVLNIFDNGRTDKTRMRYSTNTPS